jgi:hypothetical protein
MEDEDIRSGKLGGDGETCFEALMYDVYHLGAPVLHKPSYGRIDLRFEIPSKAHCHIVQTAMRRLRVQRGIDETRLEHVRDCDLCVL